jgi:hypothetical protein
MYFVQLVCVWFEIHAMERHLQTNKQTKSACGVEKKMFLKFLSTDYQVYR